MQRGQQRYQKGYNQILFIKTYLCKQKTGSRKPVTQRKKLACPLKNKAQASIAGPC